MSRPAWAAIATSPSAPVAPRSCCLSSASASPFRTGARQGRQLPCGQCRGEVKTSLTVSGRFFAGADLRFRNYPKVDAFDQLSGEVRGGVIWNRAEGFIVPMSRSNDFAWGRALPRSDHPGRRLAPCPWRRATSFAGFSAVVGHSPCAAGHAGERLRPIPIRRRLDPAAGGDRRFDAFRRRLRRRRSRAGAPQRRQQAAGWRAGGAQYGPRADTDVLPESRGSTVATIVPNALYGERRRDNQFDLNLGAAWRFAPSWSLRPTVTWTERIEHVDQQSTSAAKRASSCQDFWRCAP